MNLRTYRNWSEAARRDLKLAVLTAILLVAVTWKFPGYAAPRNLAGVLDDTAILIMLALGQMLVILVRGIDLSMAANLALCGMLAALFATFPLLLAVQAGKISDRFGVRIPIICGALTMAVGLAVAYMVSDIHWLFVCPALIGLGHIFFHVSIHNLVGSLGADAEREQRGHDDEEKQRRADVAAVAQREQQVAAHDAAEGVSHRG